MGSLVLAPAVASAERAGHRTWLSVRNIKAVVAGVDVRLQYALPPGQELFGMLVFSVARDVNQGGGWYAAIERRVVADIGPEPGGFCAAARQKWHGGVIAVQTSGDQDMPFDHRVDWRQRDRRVPDQGGDGGPAELHPFTGKALGPVVQRLMLAKLLKDQYRDQAGPGPSAPEGVERCGRLADLFTIPTRELFPDCWITFHWRGITSRVSVMSSPIFTIRPDLQQPRDVGASTSVFSRGRCSGKGFRAGFRRAKPLTVVVSEPGTCSVASVSSVAAASGFNSSVIASEQLTVARTCTKSLSAASECAVSAASAARNLAISKAASDMEVSYHSDPKKPHEYGRKTRFIPRCRPLRPARIAPIDPVQ